MLGTNHVDRRWVRRWVGAASLWGKLGHRSCGIDVVVRMATYLSFWRASVLLIFAAIAVEVLGRDNVRWRVNGGGDCLVADVSQDRQLGDWRLLPLRLVPRL